jgi:hypothetical protein
VDLTFVPVSPRVLIANVKSKAAPEVRDMADVPLALSLSSPQFDANRFLPAPALKAYPARWHTVAMAPAASAVVQKSVSSLFVMRTTEPKRHRNHGFSGVLSIPEFVNQYAARRYEHQVVWAAPKIRIRRAATVLSDL